MDIWHVPEIHLLQDGDRLIQIDSEWFPVTSGEIIDTDHLKDVVDHSLANYNPPEFLVTHGIETPIKTKKYQYLIPNNGDPRRRQESIEELETVLRSMMTEEQFDELLQTVNITTDFYKAYLSIYCALDRQGIMKIFGCVNPGFTSRIIDPIIKELLHEEGIVDFSMSAIDGEDGLNHGEYRIVLNRVYESVIYETFSLVLINKSIILETPNVKCTPSEYIVEGKAVPSSVTSDEPGVFGSNFSIGDGNGKIVLSDESRTFGSNFPTGIRDVDQSLTTATQTLYLVDGIISSPLSSGSASLSEVIDHRFSWRPRDFLVAIDQKFTRTPYILSYFFVTDDQGISHLICQIPTDHIPRTLDVKLNWPSNLTVPQTTSRNRRTKRAF